MGRVRGHANVVELFEWTEDKTGASQLLGADSLKLSRDLKAAALRMFCILWIAMT